MLHLRVGTGGVYTLGCSRDQGQPAGGRGKTRVGKGGLLSGVDVRGREGGLGWVSWLGLCGLGRMGEEGFGCFGLVCYIPHVVPFGRWR